MITFSLDHIDDDSEASYEVMRLLTALTAKIQSNQHGFLDEEIFILRDINGNKVGAAGLTL